MHRTLSRGSHGENAYIVFTIVRVLLRVWVSQSDLKLHRLERGARRRRSEALLTNRPAAATVGASGSVWARLRLGAGVCSWRSRSRRGPGYGGQWLKAINVKHFGSVGDPGPRPGGRRRIRGLEAGRTGVAVGESAAAALARVTRSRPRQVRSPVTADTAPVMAAVTALMGLGVMPGLSDDDDDRHGSLR